MSLSNKNSFENSNRKIFLLEHKIENDIYPLGYLSEAGENGMNDEFIVLLARVPK